MPPDTTGTPTPPPADAAAAELPEDAVVAAPAVYLLGRAEALADMDRFRDDFGLPGDDPDVDSPERLVETAGRNCYWSFARPRPGGNPAYIANLIRSGHGSCLEFASWVLLIAGISRSLSHELVRHRCFSFAQTSQRYVDSSHVRFVEPPAYLALAADHPVRVAWRRHCAASLDTYRHLVRQAERFVAIRSIENPTDRRKAARESARSVLPNCTETRIVVAMNARAARHFLDLRGGLHADAEIRRLALAIFDLLAAEAPAVFADFRAATERDGRVHLVSEYGSV